MTQVIIVEMFESRIDGQAWSKPASIAAESVRPVRSSSFMRAKISTLASTAMPIERMKPAMPASVSTTPSSLKTAKVKRV